MGGGRSQRRTDGEGVGGGTGGKEMQGGRPENEERGEKNFMVTLVGGRCEDGGGARQRTVSQNSGSPAPNQTQNHHGNKLTLLSSDRNFQILSYYK